MLCRENARSHQGPDSRHTPRFPGRRHPDQVRIAPAASTRAAGSPTTTPLLQMVRSNSADTTAIPWSRTPPLVWQTAATSRSHRHAWDRPDVRTSFDVRTSLSAQRPAVPLRAESTTPPFALRSERPSTGAPRARSGRDAAVAPAPNGTTAAGRKRERADERSGLSLLVQSGRLRRPRVRTRFVAQAALRLFLRRGCVGFRCGWRHCRWVQTVAGLLRPVVAWGCSRCLGRASRRGLL